MMVERHIVQSRKIIILMEIRYYKIVIVTLFVLIIQVIKS